MNCLVRACLVWILCFPTTGVLTATAALNVQIGQNFTASTLLSDTTSLPPDSDGAIGPDHYVEFINGRFSVWNKTNAAVVQAMTDKTFWNNAGVSFGPSVSISDPRIVYDKLSQRWFASQVDFR